MSTALKQMTADEFLLWAEGRDGRWELHDGRPAMMAPERAAHAEAKAEAFVALRESIKGARLPCPVYPDGMAIRIDARTTYEPDVSVVCGPRPPADALALDNPIIVVEVLSPSTVAIDHVRNLSGYFSLPSIEHYLILDPERRVAIHHKRGQGEAIETRVLSNGSARFDPPGFELAVEALFPAA